MPHIPIQKLSPSVTTKPRSPFKQERPPVPYHGSSQGEQKPEIGLQNKKMIPRLSITNFEMPVDRIHQQLFGKEATKHEFTGELVSN